ncbi:MAG TPA: TIGR02270 family protein [Rhizobacter sp.]
MQVLERKPVPIVVWQHVESAASLRRTRTVLVRAPHVRLLHLRRLDDRLAAQLDGVAVAGDAGRAVAQAALESPGVGELFTATANALVTQDNATLARMLALAEALPAAMPGLLSAFGWVTPQALRGVTKALLDAATPFAREVGLAACAMHGVSPAASLLKGAAEESPSLRARALRYLGEAGVKDGLLPCLKALADEDLGCRFHAARSAALLGDRQDSLAALGALAAAPGPWQRPALLFLLRFAAPTDAHRLLQPLAQQAAQARLLVQAVGAGGNPHYVTWLVKQMEDPKLARVAGESFSLITGLDLAHLDFDVRNPPEPANGPTEDAADEQVALDEDESLPYPDVAKVHAWWSAHGSRFTPGARYLMGQPVDPAQCLAVLRTAFQRQRAAAAETLCLLQPGTPLFNVAAPASRQERQLQKMS